MCRITRASSTTNPLNWSSPRGAGTPLTVLIDCVEQQGQMLSFEPPLFGGKATIGGTLACNMSGPSRPWSGSVRDMVLGVQLINGKAELLNFGGKVMKNVAGYDVSRLQAGALGTLGVLSEISLKVLPKHEHSLTLCYDMTAAEAVNTMNQRAGEPKPLYGACWLNDRLYLRLSGAAEAVATHCQAMGWRCSGEPRYILARPARHDPALLRRQWPLMAFVP